MRVLRSQRLRKQQELEQQQQCGTAATTEGDGGYMRSTGRKAPRRGSDGAVPSAAASAQQQQQQSRRQQPQKKKKEHGRASAASTSRQNQGEEADDDDGWLDCERFTEGLVAEQPIAGGSAKRKFYSAYVVVERHATNKLVDGRRSEIKLLQYVEIAVRTPGADGEAEDEEEGMTAKSGRRRGTASGDRKKRYSSATDGNEEDEDNLSSDSSTGLRRRKKRNQQRQRTHGSGGREGGRNRKGQSGKAKRKGGATTASSAVLNRTAQVVAIFKDVPVTRQRPTDFITPGLNSASVSRREQTGEQALKPAAEAREKRNEDDERDREAEKEREILLCGRRQTAIGTEIRKDCNTTGREQQQHQQNSSKSKSSGSSSSKDNRGEGGGGNGRGRVVSAQRRDEAVEEAPTVAARAAGLTRGSTEEEQEEAGGKIMIEVRWLYDRDDILQHCWALGVTPAENELPKEEWEFADSDKCEILPADLIDELVVAHYDAEVFDACCAAAEASSPTSAATASAEENEEKKKEKKKKEEASANEEGQDVRSPGDCTQLAPMNDRPAPPATATATAPAAATALAATAPAAAAATAVAAAATAAAAEASSPVESIILITHFFCTKTSALLPLSSSVDPVSYTEMLLNCARFYNRIYKPLRDGRLLSPALQDSREGQTDVLTDSANKQQQQQQQQQQSSSLPQKHLLREAVRRLQLDAVPEGALPCREKEWQQIRQFVRSSILQRGNGEVLYISGLPGTGKTATVHAVLRQLQQEAEDSLLPPFDAIEVNAMRLPHPEHFFSVLHWHLFGFKPRNAQQAFAALDRRFTCGNSSSNEYVGNQTKKRRPPFKETLVAKPFSYTPQSSSDEEEEDEEEEEEEEVVMVVEEEEDWNSSDEETRRSSDATLSTTSSIRKRSNSTSSNTRRSSSSTRNSSSSSSASEDDSQMEGESDSDNTNNLNEENDEDKQKQRKIRRQAILTKDRRTRNRSNNPTSVQDEEDYDNDNDDEDEEEEEEKKERHGKQQRPQQQQQKRQQQQREQRQCTSDCTSSSNASTTSPHKGKRGRGSNLREKATSKTFASSSNSNNNNSSSSTSSSSTSSSSTSSSSTTSTSSRVVVTPQKQAKKKSGSKDSIEERRRSQQSWRKNASVSSAATTNHKYKKGGSEQEEEEEAEEDEEEGEGREVHERDEYKISLKRTKRKTIEEGSDWMSATTRKQISPSHTKKMKTKKRQKRKHRHTKRHRPCVLVVDEVDCLLTQKQRVLYSLFDWPSHKHAGLVVIGIANTLDLPERIQSARCASRLGFGRLVFNPYTREQIEEIVLSRLRECRALFDEAAIKVCARKVANFFGDLRRALQVLRCALERRRADNLIYPSDIAQAANHLFESPLKEAILALPRGLKLLLFALLQAQRVDGESVSLLALRHRYEGLLLRFQNSSAGITDTRASLQKHQEPHKASNAETSAVYQNKKSFDAAGPDNTPAFAQVPPSHEELKRMIDTLVRLNIVRVGLHIPHRDMWQEAQRQPCSGDAAFLPDEAAALKSSSCNEDGSPFHVRSSTAISSYNTSSSGYECGAFRYLDPIVDEPEGDMEASIAVPWYTDGSSDTHSVAFFRTMEEERHAHRRSSRESGLGAGEEENREPAGAPRPQARGRSEEETANGGGGMHADYCAATTLYVSNIPLRCSLGDIRRIFEEVGEVRDCRIVTNPVTRDPANSSIAIERLDGKAFCGDSTKPLRVERAKRNRPHQPTPGLYKGPPGASVKYDKSGRLRPGFLPYYAVAPGASREFYPPAAAMGLPPFDYFYDGHPPGGRGERGRGGGWPDERGYMRSSGGAAGGGGGYEYVRSGVGGAYVDRYGGSPAEYVPRGGAAGYADNGAAASSRGDYYGYGSGAAGSGRVGEANGRSSAYSSSRSGGAGAAAGNNYYYDVGRGAGGGAADALYDARGSAGYEGRGAATAVYYGEQRAADEAMARYAAYGGEFYYNTPAPSGYEGYTTRGAEGHREKIPRDRSRSRDRGRDRRRSASGSRPRRSTRR